MKKSLIVKIVLVTLLLSTGICSAKQNRYNSEVEFGDPKGQRIVVFSGSGDLTVTGYKGDKVLIYSDENIFKQEDEEVNEKAKGLKRIGGGGFNIINNKKNNIIIISRPVDKNIALTVKVPNDIILKFGSDVNKESWGSSNFVNQIISTIFKGDKNGENSNFIGDIIGNTLGGVLNGILDGEINIKDFAGIVEVNTVQGNINAENIRGAVFASSVDGDVRVVFDKLQKDRDLYFSSVDGDIDLTLPKDTKANIMAKTLDGDVYSGFEGDVTVGKQINDDTATPGSQNNFSRIFQSNYITTSINGGGQAIYLNTIDGDVYIRKGD